MAATVERYYISKSVNQPRVPEINAGLRGKGAEMLQAIRPGVSAGVTGFLVTPPNPHCSRAPLLLALPVFPAITGNICSINTGFLFYSPNLLDYHDYIYR
jgi:hypothetical protein